MTPGARAGVQGNMRAGLAARARGVRGGAEAPPPPPTREGADLGPGEGGP